jgi:hypothetical protein
MRRPLVAAAVVLQYATCRRCPQVALDASLLMRYVLAHVAAPAHHAGDETMMMLLREVPLDVQAVPLQVALHRNVARAQTVLQSAVGRRQWR